MLVAVVVLWEFRIYPKWRTPSLRTEWNNNEQELILDVRFNRISFAPLTRHGFAITRFDLFGNNN